METILHVQASPRGEDSLSARVAKKFLDRYCQLRSDTTIDRLDVFSADLPEFAAPAARAKYAVLAGQEPKDDDARAWKQVVEVVDGLKAADLVLISCGMWNFSIPYRLKQWIDVVVQPQMTFAFSPEQGYRGLLMGRAAVLVLARGGEYAGSEMDMQRPYLQAILGFMGISDVHTILVEPTLAAGEEVAEEKLSQAIAQAEALAEKL